MTDPKLVEQAEREIATELGFSLDLSRQIVNTGKESGFTFSFMERYPPMATKLLVKIWPALVRDRCSLLALRKAAKVGFLPLGVLVKSGEVELNDWLSPELKVAIREGEEALRGALEGER
jgi:hypothetical protein